MTRKDKLKVESPLNDALLKSYLSLGMDRR